MNKYLNLGEVYSAMANLATAYPDDCELIRLPYPTYEGRIVRALRIGRKQKTQTIFNRKVGVLFTGCAHAREWGGADILIYLASDLLKAYTAGQGLSYSLPGQGPGQVFSAAELQRMRARVDLFLVPLVNPDGRTYSMTTKDQSLWRKNRNPASSGGVASSIGVDVNRNFDFLWDYRKAFASQVWNKSSMASDDPASDNFRGVAPNSEPETRNVVYLFASQPQIAYFVDVHSFTGDVLYPWNDAPNQSVRPTQNFRNPAHDGQRGMDDLSVYGEYLSERDQTAAIELGETLASAINRVSLAGYAVTQGFYLVAGSAGGSAGATYPTGGTADDYATSRGSAVPGASDVLGFTLEFHRDGGADWDYAFHPPFPKMAEIITEVEAGLIAFCLEAERRHRVFVRIPEIVHEILFGITAGGGGVILVNGVPTPLPPGDPFIPSLAAAARVYADAEALPPESRREARRAALRAMEDAIAAAERAAGPG